MIRRVLIVAAAGGVLAGALAVVWAGQRVDADKENVVAGRLVGKWKLNVKLTQRLRGKKVTDAEVARWTVAFTSDPAVAALVPDKYDQFLKRKRVYMAGKLTWYGKERPFILISHKGNPHVVYFRPKGDDPMGDAESFNLCLAPAKDKVNDLLFIGGDFNNQPFSAFDRVRETDE